MLKLHEKLLTDVSQGEISSTTAPVADAWNRLPATNVVFLVNFVAPNLLDVFRELSKRVGRLTIVSSVAIEGNRDWKPETDGLEVVVQRTWTITRTAVHPSGYREPNYIHIPLDTFHQLRRIKPDVIISLELGARTFLSQLYRRMRSNVVHIAGVLASERSEAGRGLARVALRKGLLRVVDGVTYNGPSCRRYLLSLGADPLMMSPWDYAADRRKTYDGPLPDIEGGRDLHRILTVGQLTERKGIVQAAAALQHFASEHPDRKMQWNVVGNGPQREVLQSTEFAPNLKLNLIGHCDPEQLRVHYRDNDLLLFPTLGDEWGLVVDEAFASGLPVLGSIHSQAVETLITDNHNGYKFDPDNPMSFSMALNRWWTTNTVERAAMRSNARKTVVSRTAVRAASQLVDAIAVAMRQRGIRCEQQRVDASTPCAAQAVLTCETTTCRGAEPS